MTENPLSCCQGRLTTSCSQCLHPQQASKKQWWCHQSRYHTFLPNPTWRKSLTQTLIQFCLHIDPVQDSYPSTHLSRQLARKSHVHELLHSINLFFTKCFDSDSLLSGKDPRCLIHREPKTQFWNGQLAITNHELLLAASCVSFTFFLQPKQVEKNRFYSTHTIDRSGWPVEKCFACLLACLLR